MQQQEIIAKLQTVFDAIFLEPVHVTPELTANEVEEWDSLLHVSLIIAIESTFRIRFRLGEIEGTKSVGDLVKVIQKRLPQN